MKAENQNRYDKRQKNKFAPQGSKSQNYYVTQVLQKGRKNMPKGSKKAQGTKTKRGGSHGASLKFFKPEPLLNMETMTQEEIEYYGISPPYDSFYVDIPGHGVLPLTDERYFKKVHKVFADYKMQYELIATKYLYRTICIRLFDNGSYQVVEIYNESKQDLSLTIRGVKYMKSGVTQVASVQLLSLQYDEGNVFLSVNLNEEGVRDSFENPQDYDNLTQNQKNKLANKMHDELSYQAFKMVKEFAEGKVTV